MKRRYREGKVWLQMTMKHLWRAPDRGTTAVRGTELVVETRQAGARTIVVVVGRVTVDSSPHLRPVLHDAIGAAPPAGVVIDFTGTSYLDTSAVATLLEAATLAAEHGVALRVIGLHGEARVVAETVELDRIFLTLGFEVQVT
jgi:anti-sigma B factor antagonist